QRSAGGDQERAPLHLLRACRGRLEGSADPDPRYQGTRPQVRRGRVPRRAPAEEGRPRAGRAAMKRGCLNNALFGLLVFVIFGFSTYLCFTFFVHGRSLPTPNLIGKSAADAKAMCSDLGLTLEIGQQTRDSDKVPAGFVVWQNRSPGTTNFIKRGTRIKVELSAGP